MEVNPLSIILVKSDSKGDRLLFRYPFSSDAKPDNDQKNSRKNPYALIITEDLLQSLPLQTSNISKGNLTGLTDEVLSNLFAVKPELCERKFELKVNDVCFVGHPTLFQPGSIERSDSCTGNIPTINGSSINHSDTPSAILINVVFALHSFANHSIVKCYYDLSKRIGIALKHEEKRCCYVTIQTKEMIAAHDEIAQKIADTANGNFESPYELILHRSSLAKDLKKVYDDLRTTGLVQIRVNKWIEVSFCLPHKVHQTYYMKKGFIIEPDSIDKCLQSLRPYHGLLLLVDQSELLESLPPDSSPALLRLIQVYSPLKSLQTLSADADITLMHIFQLTGHLVYWAKAMVIYPLCENNVYVIAPDASTQLVSPLVEKFSEKFSGENLLQVMSDFSLPTSLNQKLSPLIPQAQQKQMIQMIAWMLQHRLLLQLHTYVHLMPSSEGHPVEYAKKTSAKSTPREHRSRSQSGSDFNEDTCKLFKLKNDVSGFKSCNDTFGREDDEKGSFPYQMLENFTPEEKAAILKIPASANYDDLYLLVKLFNRGYLTGKHHLEDIMYSENIKRSHLLQVLDKFRDVLVTCEIEDPAISMFYSHYKLD
ncbi:UNVERIFIED_CONTAM: hypothetical protein PYX00_009246 [Menopon gallinae]|uniref:GATOR complex protein NPRL3 n=1 Tax=Menopon gallinae TaxID=328185 RepID=A0AAW2HAF3_9NEOP